MTKIVGLTGGIGSGKSQVRQMFAALGVPAWDADIIARDIHQDASHVVLPELRKAFGDVLDTTGRLDRAKMREHLRQFPNANRQLKALLGPHVVKTLQTLSAATPAPYVVWESALIIEEAIPVDRILLIDCEVATQIARVKLRNPDWDTAHILHMISLQTDRATRQAAATDCIINETTTEALRLAVIEQHQKYLTLWEQ